MINLKNSKQKVHLIGVGGVGVSALAEILLNKGFTVTGSDMKKSELTEKLENHGAKIFYTHDASNIDGVDFIVYTAAVSFENPELKKAKEENIPCITRAQMLGMIMDEYKKSIAISGTHGKTTTTSMVSVILNKSSLDPTLLIGGKVKELGSNTKVGSGEVIVTEACEYKNSFHHFKSNIAVILNIDEDHLDFFSGIDEIKQSFMTFIDIIPNEGVLIINGDDENCKDVISHSKANTKTFGLTNDSYCYADNITHDKEGHPIFDVIVNNVNLGKINLSIPGDHNIYNALAAILATLECGVSFETIAKPLSLFKGAVRRFDIVGDYNGAKVIDDYAHHPSEIKATLNAVKTLPHNEVICIFQPHTYTRTYELLEEFGTAFDDADHVIITEIYAARETDTGMVHSKDLVEKIKQTGKDAIYLKSFEEIEAHLEKHSKNNDIIFTMGAGNINELGYKIVKK